MFRIFIIIVMAWMCGSLSASAQADDKLISLISKYETAIDKGKARRAARYAKKLAVADYSSAPLSALEVRGFKADLAQALLDGRKHKQARELLVSLIAEDTAAIMVAQKAQSGIQATTEAEALKIITPHRLEISDIRAASAERKLQLAELYVKSGEVDAALEQMLMARSDLDSVYGGAPEYDTYPVDRGYKYGSSDAVVSEIAIFDKDGDIGGLNPAVAFVTVMMVDTVIDQTYPGKPISQKTRAETIQALRYLYKARLYITDQCGYGNLGQKLECSPDEEGQYSILTLKENAVAIAEHWRVYANYKLRDSAGFDQQDPEFLSSFIAAYVALEEASHVLDFYREATEELRSAIDGEIKKILDKALADSIPLEPIERGYLPAAPPPQASMSTSEERYSRVTVFYGTTREDGRKYASADKTYRGKRNKKNQLSYGSIDMTVPYDRTVGSVPAPSFGIWPNPSVHILLKRVNKMSSSQGFGTALADSITKSPRAEKEAFVFVHGHAETFASAARRTAQLAIDLDVKHGATFFTWPAGSVVRYGKSEAEAEHAAKPLAEFLNVVAASSKADKIHIIAHSMGNRVLLKALQDSAFTADDEAFEQIIWASPDVDSCKFADEMPFVANSAKGMTLYASANDKALKLSEWLHDPLMRTKSRQRCAGNKFQRAGQSPPLSALRTPEIAKILTAVDTTNIDPEKADFIAHSDYTGGAITDLQSVVWLSLSPKARCISRTVGANPYWKTQYIDGCGEEDYSMALRQVRDHGHQKALTAVPAEMRRAEVIENYTGDRQEQQKAELLRRWEAAKSILKAQFAVQ
jgi:esterase/lipase superfamily enzyme